MNNKLIGGFFVAVAAFILMPASAWTQQTAPKPPLDLIQWNDGKLIYGVDYYPEHWDESQWAKDAEMMQAAGINFVRLAEFAWVKLETAESRFDFAWLDRALKVLNGHDIRAVLGTPTASPPAWLMAKYPDIAATNEEGIRYRYGSRRNYCLHNPNFIAATRRIVTAMAEHYKNHPGVIGWQIDNELGDPPCYDAVCQAAFQKWCKAKYPSLEALNQAWGTIFWGHTYGAWSEIPLPWNTLFQVHSPSLALDYHRFFSDASRDYLKFQADILRAMTPDKSITHNEMGMFDQVDYSQMNTAIDFVSFDNYPMFNKDYASYFQAGLALDLMRGSKANQNFLIMEEQAGMPGWKSYWAGNAPVALYRVWAYQALAHGADGICYFRWRTSRYGTEQYWHGILDQDSYPNPRYATVARMGQEMPQVTAALRGSKVVSAVGLLVSPDSRWAFHIQPLVKNFDYDRQLRLYYAAFRRARMNVDVLFPSSDFSAYKIIVAPSLFVVDKALAAKLVTFVQEGGTLVLSYRSGVKDAHNVVTQQTLPGPFAELAGAAIHEYDPQVDQEQTVVGPGYSRFPAQVWFDVLEPTTAQVIATYGKGLYAGKAAATVNTYGNGTVIYVGTESPSPVFYERLAARAAQAAKLQLAETLPEGVELAVRENGDKKIIFLLNYTENAHEVSLDQDYQNVLTRKTEPQKVVLGPFEVRVLTNPPPQGP
jgi:beta-galactosidase